MAGFTLIEIMVVIALVGLFAGGAIVGFGAVRRGRLRAGAVHVSAAFRFAYVHALTTGRATRVAFAMGSNEMWVEDTDDAHVLDSRARLRTGTAAEVEGEAQQDAELSIQMRPRAPRAEFTQPDNPRFRRRVVEQDVQLAKLFTSHTLEPREDGTGYVYFFSGGLAERAVIQLHGTSGETFTVVLNPLSGRSEIYDHAVEPPPDDTRDHRDEDEVDEREQGVIPSP